MSERVLRLAAAASLALLTGCNRERDPYFCPKTEVVSDMAGGRNGQWEPETSSKVPSNLLSWNGERSVFRGTRVGIVWVEENNGTLRMLLPGEKAEANVAFFKCDKYIESNPLQPQSEPYRSSFEAIGN